MSPAIDYNTCSHHTSLSRLTPNEFATRSKQYQNPEIILVMIGSHSQDEVKRVSFCRHGKICWKHCRRYGGQFG